MSDIEVKAIQRRRGTTAEHKTFKTGLEAELTVNTTNNSVVISDGKGNVFETARADLSNVNQINILQHGILDNSLSNFLVNYEYNPEDGSVKISAKNSSTIISQLSNAMIADKEMKNVPLSAITNKGIAQDNLKNVKFSSISWDSDTKNRLGGMESIDISGGGVVFRNLTNIDVLNFDVIPDKTGVGGSGVAWKNLANISGVTLNTLRVNGICDSQLLNVSYVDLYGKDGVTSYNSEGSGKFLLRRDLSNVVTVDYSSLNSAGIARDNFYNVKFVEFFDRPDEDNSADSEGYTGTKKKTNELQIAHKDLQNVSRDILTGTGENDKFKLMSYDGQNADKLKVFKGSKNFLFNTLFKTKRFDYDDDKVDSQFTTSEKQGYSKWIARNLNSVTCENIMYKFGEGVRFQGVFTQSIKDIGKILNGKKFYFTCDIESDKDIKIALTVNDEIDNLLTKTFDLSKIDNNYSIRYAEFDFTNPEDELNGFDSVRLENSKYITLVLMSEELVTVIHPQLELYNPTNWDNRSPELEYIFNKSINQNIVELVGYGDTLPEATGSYVRLKSSYTSDDPEKFYYFESDHIPSQDEEEVDVLDDEIYIKSNNKIYCYENGVVEYYGESSKYQFRVYEQNLVNLSKYRDYSLFYLTDDNRIYTFVDDSWRIIEDPIPYKDTMYYLKKDGVWHIYVLNTLTSSLEEMSISGGSNSVSLPIFFHVKSDKRMNSPSWVCSDNFSELSAKVYQGAFDYLSNQVHPVGKFIPSGREVYNDETSSSEDLNTSMWIVEWTDNSYETTSVLMSSGSINDVKNWAQNRGYTITKDSSDIKELEISRIIEKKSYGDIEYYETFDGLKVVVANTVEETNSLNEKLRNLYETSGWAWFYFIGKSEFLDGENFFKLPRSKGLEISGDVHPSHLGNTAGDRYEYNLLEGSSGSVGTLMSTYFYVGFPAVQKELIQTGKTLEVVNEINSKIRSTIVRGVSSYIDDSPYFSNFRIDGVDYEVDFYENIITDSTILEINMDGEDVVVTFDVSSIPSDKLTIEIGYNYPIIISYGDGTSEESILVFNTFSNEADVQIKLDERFSTVMIASAKRTSVNIDTSLLKTPELSDIEFNVIVDRRSVVNKEGDTINYSGEVSVKVNGLDIVNSDSSTIGEYSRYKVYSVPKYYNDTGSTEYNFLAKKV